MRHKRTPTSKKFAWIILLVYAFSVVASYLVQVIYGVNTGYILTSTTASTGIVLTGYFGKSFLENKEQYGTYEKEGENNEYPI